MSSGNGGGKGFFDNIASVDMLSGKGNFFENVIHDVVNASIQGVTAGVLGYEDGKISNGYSTNIAKSSGKAIVSGVKEVTGAKAAEQANDLARQQVAEAKAEAMKAREEAQARTARDQMTQSQVAATARNANTNKKSTAMLVGSQLGADEKDFLGL